MGLLSRLTTRIDRIAETTQNAARRQIERDLRACGLLGTDEAVVAMAEATHMNQKRTQWGRVWIITEEKTVVWLPRERRPLLTTGHSDARTFTGGNFSAGIYVAYVVDTATRQNLIKDHFIDVPEEFAKILDSMRTQEEETLQAQSAAAADSAVGSRGPAEQNKLTYHIDQMMQLADTLRRQGLISGDERPTSSSLEIDINENGEVRGPGRYLWVFTNYALHIINVPASGQQRVKVRLDFSDPEWTMRIKSNPADTRMLVGLISRDGVGVHGGALLATDDMFTADLMMTIKERSGS